MRNCKLTITGRACVTQWIDVVLNCILVEQLLQFGKFFRELFRKIHSLREVFTDVVQLPHFLRTIKVHTLEADPRQTTMETRGHPTLVIDGAITQNLKVLSGVGTWGTCVIE